VTDKTEDEHSQSPGKRGETPVSEREKKAYEIDIFKAWCKACGICAAFCPRECLGRDEEGAPYVRDADRCTGCGWCELHCPDFAISVRQRKPEDNRAAD
jgi:2-oxoglutarate ferredoxin oxidoreductase subunit delta